MALNHICLKEVVAQMEPNLRITLSKKLIGFKELEKNLPLKIDYLRISSARVVINKTYYTMWATDQGYRLNINEVPTENIITDKKWRCMQQYLLQTLLRRKENPEVGTLKFCVGCLFPPAIMFEVKNIILPDSGWGDKCALHHIRPYISLSSYQLDSLTIRDFHNLDHRIVVNAKELIAAIEPDRQENLPEEKIVKFKNQRVLFKIAHKDFCNYTVREWSGMKLDIGRWYTMELRKAHRQGQVSDNFEEYVRRHNRHHPMSIPESRMNENEKYCAWIDRGDGTEMNIWFEEGETWRGHFRIDRLGTATPLAWYEGPVGKED
ncbi:unnamed protein product [Caenorhabditis nigoni]